MTLQPHKLLQQLDLSTTAGCFYGKTQCSKKRSQDYRHPLTSTAAKLNRDLRRDTTDQGFALISLCHLIFFFLKWLFITCKYFMMCKKLFQLVGTVQYSTVQYNSKMHVIFCSLLGLAFCHSEDLKLQS